MANALKTAWNNGEATLGLWASSPDPNGAEVYSGLGYDYINVDMQHGLVDYSDAVQLFRALTTTDSVVTCRVPWNEPGIIGKVLDAGARGVIIPMVNTAEQAAAAISACRYVPEGARSYGPIRAAREFGADYFEKANTEIVCVPMIETVEALENLDSILDVPGIDAVYVGPADLSISLGFPPGTDTADPAFQDALSTIVDGCKKRGIAPGIHATPAWAPKRLEQGFQMVTVTSDLAALASGASAALKSTRNASGGGDGADEKIY